MGFKKQLFLGALFIAGLAILAPVVDAQDEAPADPVAMATDIQNNLNIVWTCVAAFLVFFMQAGFAMVEAGFTRAKNVVNILMKNLMDFAIGSLAFFMVGFGLMFGMNNSGWIGTSDFFLNFAPYGDTFDTQWPFTFLIFQTVFAATAATIVSGAMAERTKFVSYLIYSLLISAFIYPIFGAWSWNGLYGDTAGWLEAKGFLDFAGSTVVHSIGGWLALAGAIILGPRIGKYGPDGRPRAIPGHNLALGALGVFILWLGWFGFNPGSTTTGNGMIGYIAVTTNLAGAAGALSAMITAWIIVKKPDGSMTMNGVLAGLVGITAGCDGVSPMGAVIIGLIAGVLVVLSILLLDAVLKIDDPVGAVSVHGVCGLWGTLAVGLFNTGSGLFYGGGADQLLIQALGAGAAFVWAFGTGMVLFLALKYTVGLRVSEDEEIRGLDIGEHGMEGYSGFQIFNNQ
ncbi:MAG: ammonium transporter [Candidatus Hydrogenedentes bacterium]|nr:ammonium transporter [Candidatus Hydrogenedentota bacterium]